MKTTAEPCGATYGSAMNAPHETSVASITAMPTRPRTFAERSAATPQA
jgi:hypothetical protein